MTGTYLTELEDLSRGFGPLPYPSTPAGEALAWWIERVRHRSYAGLKEELPSGGLPARSRSTPASVAF